MTACNAAYLLFVASLFCFCWPVISLLWPSIAGHTLYTGRLGVECFFVLSGRLMAEILFVRKIPIDVFYWRRASRILLAFWIFIGGIIFVASFATSFQVSLLDVVSALTFTINYRSGDFVPGGHSRTRTALFVVSCH